MFSCPKCSYLRTLRKLSGSYALSPSSGVGLQSASQATWIHLSARRPSLRAYKRKESDLDFPLTTTRRRKFLHTATAQASETAADNDNPSAAVPESFLSLSSSSSSSTSSASSSSSLLHKELLPVCCPGCGAYAQTIDPNEPGYYSKTRKRTRKLLNQAKEALVTELKQSSSSSEPTENGEEGAVIDTEGKNGSVEETADGKEEDGSRDSTTSKGGAPPKPAGDILLDNADSATRFVEMTTLPSQVCDRCHNLLHHNQGVSAPSPTIESIRALLEESPHRSNRVYHIVDAADFPMSLIPNIYDALNLQEQRSRNRRSKTEKYKGGKKMTTISFVITRSDLLAATKEQVDSMMQRFRKVLLDVLGLKKDDVRLGNVHMISAHRGWWTKNVKEEIRDHGGGIWVVGKANVGKSSFISSCFPKDSKNLEKVAELLQRRQEAESLEAAVTTTTDDSVLLNEDSLLPPAPREELYPTLPVISSLPGTTVSPIRIPFGHGKGEVIDLPGLDRGTLQDFIKDEHKNDLVMTKRVNPERITIKPGQSLLLGGGLIRITPVMGRASSSSSSSSAGEEDGEVGKEGEQEVAVLAACFVPLETHVTKTEKALEIQAQLRPYNPGDTTNNKGKTIIKDGVFDTISSAGIFEIDTDITHNHLPILVKKRLEDQGIKPPPLPYKVLSRDILIEGCGWIELTAQIRARTTFDKKGNNNKNSDELPSSSSPSPSLVLPRVEIFTPKGQHISSRPPMETWNFIHEKELADKRKKKGAGARRGRQNISQKKRANHGGKV